MRKYFIVYVYAKENNLIVSNMIINYDSKIRRIEDIENLEKAISNAKKLNEVKIINWKKLKNLRGFRKKQLFSFENWYNCI